MNVNTKICERLNNFDIVTSHRHVGARWEGVDGSLNLWSSASYLEVKEFGFLIHYLKCQY